MRYLSSEDPWLVGRFEPGATVTITIRKISDDSIIVDAGSCVEIGTTGYFKYQFSSVPAGYAEYLWIATDGVNESSGAVVIDGYPATSSSSEETALTEPPLVIDAIKALTPLSVQSSAEAALGANTHAKLLYNSASRTQGNFTIFYAQAVRRLNKDLARYNLQMDAEEKPLAYAYLVWDLAIKKFPDWEAQTVSPGGTESVTRAKPGTTSAMAAYKDILKGAKKNVCRTPAVGEVDDYTNYPEEMNPSPIGHKRLAGVD